MLCRAGARGNQEAFDELHRRHERQLTAFVFHLLGGRHRREDAEEIVQDAFARAFASVRMHDFEGSFRALLFVVARNRTIDTMRRERLAVVPLDEGSAIEVPRAPAADEPGAAAESRADLAWLVRAIGELPERQRSALLLRELGGLSHESIAETLGTTAGSVRQLIGRGREGVRHAAGSDENAPENLRRGLLDAVPLTPVAALGGMAAIGTGAGGLGALALGKIAATILAVAAIAGAGGAIEHEVSAAEEPAPPAAHVVAKKVGDTPHRASSDAEPQPSRRTKAVGEVKTERPAPARSDAPAAAEGSAPGRDQPEAPRQQAGSEPATAPLKPVTDLPGKVLGDVGAGLSGEKPLPEVVGDVTDNTLDTVGQTARGLLDPLTAR